MKKIDSSQLEAVLAKKDWQSANNCCRLLAMKPTENNKRIIRFMAEESNGKIVGDSKGYKLNTMCDLEEVLRAYFRLRRQAFRMIQRSNEMLDFKKRGKK